jgi:hypothetical protein
LRQDALVEEQDSMIGFCYECQTKDGDSAKKTVYRCDVCGKWFCELHLKPKFPYFVDWETHFDVQGNPAVKAMFHSEYGRQDGHADFVFLRQTIDKMQEEEKIQEAAIKEKIDKMMENWQPSKNELDITIENKEKKTYQNGWGNRFTVPKEVYANKTYRERLHAVNTTYEVRSILYDFYFNVENKQRLNKQKKHWWQR